MVKREFSTCTQKHVVETAWSTFNLIAPAGSIEWIENSFRTYYFIIYTINSYDPLSVHCSNVGTLKLQSITNPIQFYD